MPIKSRLEQMRGVANDEDYEPLMPPPGDAAYLLSHFWDVGPTKGDTFIDHSELSKYQENMGLSLSPWECKTLRRLSIEYMNESQRATKADAKPPHAEAANEAALLQQAAIRRKMRAFLD